jgi:hypothetical protein
MKDGRACDFSFLDDLRGVLLGADAIGSIDGGQIHLLRGRERAIFIAVSDAPIEYGSMFYDVDAVLM